MFTREQALEMQTYYWDKIYPCVSGGIFAAQCTEMLKDKFGIDFTENELEAIAYGDFNINVESTLESLKNEGICENEMYALQILLEEVPETIHCNSCDKYYIKDINDYIEYEGRIYCENCVGDYFYTCVECGDLVYEDNIVIDSNEDVYCSSCADELLFRCDGCGQYYSIDDAITDSNDEQMCSSCFEDNYYICDDCGCFVSNYDVNYTDGGNYCNDCYEHYRIIRDYEYKPTPIFYGYGNKYLGVELEVDEGGEDSTNAESILNILEQHAYCKHDGSIHNGFEIVSHPATLDYHTNSIDWEGALQKLRNMGYTSHDAGTCGIHVHMNRDGFGDTEEEQELGISKVLYFFERHWDKIVKFSRRTHAQLDRWAARYLDGKPDCPKDVLEYAKDDMSRYRCVNLCNCSTVEIRVFRGSLIYETFMATLQFCDLMYDIAELPLEVVMNLTWNEFIKMGSKYKEFTSYIERRNLDASSSINIAV